MSALLYNQLAGLSSWLSGLFDGLKSAILSFIITPIACLLYGLQMGFFYIIDCVQSIFRKMAGLGTYYYQGEEQSGDMVLSMIQSDIVMSVFYSVLVVAIMLLFVTTFVAIIKTEFTEKNAKGPIVGKVLKGFFFFAFVPVTCIFGIWICNIFLRSFDEATNLQSSALSHTVFFAASHDANRCRTDENFANYVRTAYAEALGLKGAESQNEVALAVDKAFLQTKAYKVNGFQDQSWMTCFNFLGQKVEGDTFSITNIQMTYYFYDLFLTYNYLIGFVGGGAVALLLLSSCIALIQRLYDLSILFIMSPAAIAFMPIDNGKKYESWRGEFIKRVGNMYGPVIGINLMFMILAALQDVDLFPDEGIYALFNSIVQLIFLVVGLISVKDFTKIISSMGGFNDAAEEGEKKKEAAQKMTGRIATGTLAAAQMAKSLPKSVYGSIRGSKPGMFIADKMADHKKNKVGNKIDKDDNKNHFRAISDSNGNVTGYRRATLGERLFHKGDEIDNDSWDAGSESIKAMAKIDARDAIDGETKSKTKAARRNSLGYQTAMAMRGDGKKTALFAPFERFMKASGKDFESFGTVGGIAKRAGDGESALGNLRMYDAEFINHQMENDFLSGKKSMKEAGISRLGLSRSGKDMGGQNAGIKKSDDAEKATDATIATKDTEEEWNVDHRKKEIDAYNREYGTNLSEKDFSEIQGFTRNAVDYGKPNQNVGNVNANNVQLGPEALSSISEALKNAAEGMKGKMEEAASESMKKAADVFGERAKDTADIVWSNINRASDNMKEAITKVAKGLEDIILKGKDDGFDIGDMGKI